MVDYEIDQLVYKLYGLTKEDIKIVEGHPTLKLRMAGEVTF